MELPNWDTLPPEQKSVVDAFSKCADVMATFPPDRVVLFLAFLTDGIVGNLADRVLAARSMGADELLDPRVHVAGMALAASMSEYREAYEVMHDEEALGLVKASLEAGLAVVDELQKACTPEGVATLLQKLADMQGGHDA